MRATSCVAALFLGACGGGTADEGGPCEGGSWGAVESPSTAIHVRTDGSDGGDGTEVAPLATVHAALALALEGASEEIALGPGEFPASLDLLGEGPDGSLATLALSGCSAAETRLVPAEATEPVVRVSDVPDFSMAGLSVEGGRRAVWIWHGTTAALAGVEISGSSRVGLVVAGPATAVSLAEVTVVDTAPEVGTEGEQVGYGIMVDEASLAVAGGGVWGSTRVGLLAHRAVLDLVGTTIASTSPTSAGRLGRGIHVQDLSEVSLTGVTLSDNADAGLFSIQSLTLDLTDVEVEGVFASQVAGGDETTGDGIVLTQGSGEHFDPSTFQATLTGTSVSDPARAGIVIEDTTAGLVDVEVTGAGLVQGDSSVFTQGDAVITQGEAVPLDEPLVLNLEAVQPDSLDAR